MTIASRLRTVGAKATTIAVALAAAFGLSVVAASPAHAANRDVLRAQITPAPVNGTLWGSGSSAVTFGPRP